MLSIQNDTTEKFAIDKDGRIVTALVPSVRVYNSANQSISDSTLTAITFDSERYDTDSLHSTSSNTSRLTASVAGKYLIFANLSFATNTTGYREFTVRLNGSTYVLDDTRVPVTGNRTIATISGIYQLAAGDYIEAVVYQTSTVALNIEAVGNRTPEFGMTYLGP